MRTGLVTGMALVLVAWGALAFGAVYPWAYAPLLAGCAITGLMGLVRFRARPVDRAALLVLFAFAAVLAAGVVQLIPLPANVLRAVSPAADDFLRNHDLTYALSALDVQSTEPGAAAVGSTWHALSLDPRATLLAVGMLAAFVLFLAGLTWSLTHSVVRRLAFGIVFFGIVLALVGIVQRAILGDHAYAGMKIYGFWAPSQLLSNPFGPYVNKNHFAGWMLMALPLACGLAVGLTEHAWRHARGGWRSAVLWLSSKEGGQVQLITMGVLVMTASLLMTRSRSGAAASVVAVLLLSVAARRRFRSARAGLAALGVLGILLVTAFAVAGAEIASRVVVINRGDTVELRRSIWRDSATIVRDFPVAGTGLNTFGTAMLRYQTAQHDQHFQEAHNDYLQFAVEGGLLVGVPVLATIVLITRAIVRRFAARRDDPVTYWIRVGATVGLLTIAAQAFVEFSLQMPGNAALFVVLLAIALHQPAPGLQQVATGARRP